MEPKTPQAKRDIVLALAKLLREHWMASRFKADGELAFCHRRVACSVPGT